MKIVVTGGAGFIGSHVVDRFINEGHEVIVIDHYRRDKKRFENPKAKIYKLRFSDPKLRSVFEIEKPEVICHLAAQISVTESVKNPVEDAKTNIADSIALLKLAEDFKIEKFIFASSGGGIYAGYPEMPTPIVMDAKPLSPYGIGKQSFEYYLLAGKVPHVILRLANVYGPRQMSEGEAGVISIFIERILKSEPVKIFGDGSATRDYVYVTDIVDAFYKSAMSDFTGIVNIGTGVETSVNKLWELISAQHGGGEMNYEEARPGEVDRSVIDASETKAAINWEPTIEIEEGIKKTYEWFSEQNKTDTSD